MRQFKIPSFACDRTLDKRMKWLFKRCHTRNSPTTKTSIVKNQFMSCPFLNAWRLSYRHAEFYPIGKRGTSHLSIFRRQDRKIIPEWNSPQTVYGNSIDSHRLPKIFCLSCLVFSCVYSFFTKWRNSDKDMSFAWTSRTSTEHFFSQIDIICEISLIYWNLLLWIFSNYIERER